MANPNPGNWAQVHSSFAQVRSSKLAESLSSLQLGSQQLGVIPLPLLAHGLFSAFPRLTKATSVQQLAMQVCSRVWEELGREVISC